MVLLLVAGKTITSKASKSGIFMKMAYWNNFHNFNYTCMYMLGDIVFQSLAGMLGMSGSTKFTLRHQ